MACAADDTPANGDELEKVEIPKLTEQPDAVSSNSTPAAWQYPRERKIGGYDVIVHAPQIMDWNN